MSRTPRKKAERKTPEERHGEIRAAARALALAEGLASVTLRAIAARVGVVPALVAHYEPSMEALVADTFRAIAATEFDEVVAVTVRETAPRDRMRAFLGTALDEGRDDVSAVWVDAWSISRRNEPLAEALRDIAGAWQEFASGIVQDGIDSGEFGARDASAVAWLVIGIIDGLNAQSVIHSRQNPATIRVVQRAIERELALPEDALAPR